MNNNYRDSDDPTQPARYLASYNQPQGERGQGYSSGARKPYQFPGQQPAAPVNPSAWQQPQQPGYPGPAQQPGYPGPAQQPGYPGQQPGYPGPAQQQPGYRAPQQGGNFGDRSGGRKSGRGRTRKRRGCLIGCLGSSVILLILIIFLFTTSQKVLAFGSVISNQSPLSTQTGYMGGSSRINILLMGYGGSGHDGAYLTDSMVIMSLLPQSHHTTLISVPRDLWVQNPANSGDYTKLNAVYPVAAGDTNTNPVSGGNAVAQKISLITGLQINYWITINFAGFKDFINAIGGVDVTVPDAFTAMYPANDDPAVNPNWITVKFTRGLQHMDGQRAIIYARARYVLDNNAEGSDFARSQRQQLIMKAALVKLKDWHTWPQFYGAMDTLEHTLYSNLSLADLGEFAQKMDLNTAHHVGISNQNVLVDATANDGESILQPKGGDWSLIPSYIQQQLYT